VDPKDNLEMKAQLDIQVLKENLVLKDQKDQME